jgi:hypothetical protein
MRDLRGKKILFIAPKFFGYEVEITLAMRRLGAIVDYFDERPSNKSWIKAVIRINKNLIKWKINQYYSKIITLNNQNKYDYVFFIHSETPFKSTLKKLRNSNLKATYILYMWDSMLHRSNVLKIKESFDIVFTYDRLDAIKYGLYFRPLFFSKKILDNSYQTPIYDLAFIGTLHSDRYFIIKKIDEQCKKYGLKPYWYLYSHNNLTFYKTKFSSIKNIKLKRREITFKPLNDINVVKILQSSKIIIDIQHPENNGLTMRTIEALGLQKKIMTTNQEIMNYDFYNVANCCVINRKNPLIDFSFFKIDYKTINEDIYKYYSIDNWVHDIFNPVNFKNLIVKD